MWCRTINTFFELRPVRRLLSTPAAEHQTDIEGYLHRERAEEKTFLEAFGTYGDVAGERVLDLGCGLGTKAAAVARAGAEEVVGVDFDLEKIHRARSLVDRGGARNIMLAVQSGAGLAFGHDRFDVVLLLDVIEHLPDPEAVLAECARVLRKGGRVLVSFPPYRSAWGGHLFTHVPIPWVHLLFPDREVLDLWREIHSKVVVRGAVRCSAKRAHAIIEAETTTALWDCNGMTISRFLDLVDRGPLELKEIRFKTLGNLPGFVTGMPRLREFLVTRLMVVLEA